MMKNTKHTCGFPCAQINGRTLQQAINETAGDKSFGPIPLNAWKEVCPKCDAKVLGEESGILLPFYLSDGRICTITDLNKRSGKVQTSIMEFGLFRFTMSALENGMALSKQDWSNDDIHEIKKLAKKVRRLADSKMYFDFSERVCDWAKGGRVWGNMKRYNKRMLGKRLQDWLGGVHTAQDYQSAIAPGVALKGLNVSFASKHLRWLDPGKYAVLDAVLSSGLGYALSPQGYALFMKHLHQFKADYNLPQDVSSIEMGIFSLVRQFVRSTADNDNN